MDIIAEHFKEALLSSDEAAARGLMNESKQQYTSLQFVEKVLTRVLDQIGDGWEKGEYALSQVYMSGKICERLIESLPGEQRFARKDKPKMAIALLNDYHALGKRIVLSHLRSGGYIVTDYDRVDEKELVEQACEDQVELLLVSVLMLSSALSLKEVIQQIRYQCPAVKVAVGGAPFRLDNGLWQEVGADFAGFSAADSLRIASSFNGGKK